jgi:prepilin-type N-terminal cleavage/methylation domain-containing protein
MHHNFSKKGKHTFTRGFGLVELMVSISIVVLVTSIILVRHTSYNGAVLLRSQAYEVALQAREIQLSAVSAILEAGGFRNVFGLHFDTNTPDYYLNFKDDTTSGGNFYYDSGEQIGKRNNIDKRFEIGEIRLMNGGTTVSTPTAISIVFERPNFDARFFTSAGTEVTTASTVEIDISLKGATGTGTGEVRTVEISRTGQITVQ